METITRSGFEQSVGWVGSQRHLLIWVVPLAVWLFVPFGNFLAALALAVCLSRSSVAAHATRSLVYQTRLMILLIACYVATFLVFGFAPTAAVALVGAAGVFLAATRLPPPPAGATKLPASAKVLTIFLVLLYSALLAFRVNGGKITVTTPAGFDQPYEPLASHTTESEVPFARDFLLASLIVDVYPDDHKLDARFWKRIRVAENNATGFYAAAYRHRHGEVVIAFRGTELRSRRDIATDVSMLLGVPPAQFADAKEFFAQVSRESPVRMVVGHSLGGALAQLIAAESGTPSFTVNAFGAASLVNSWGHSAAIQRPSKGTWMNLKFSNDIVSDAQFEYTLSGIISSAYAFLQGTYPQHVGCVSMMQWGGYADQRQEFPGSLLVAHSIEPFARILATGAAVDPGEIRCSPPQDRVGLLLGRKIRPNSVCD